MKYTFLCINKVKIIFLFSFIFLVCSSVYGQILIDNTSFGIGEGVNITVTSDMEVGGSVEWLNNGTVTIIPLTYSGIVFNVKEGEECQGRFVFAGDGDILLSSFTPFIQIQNINIERDIGIENDIHVCKSLKLSEGIVELNNNSTLVIMNDDGKSIIHNCEDSYVLGKLMRRVRKNGGDYSFPIGSSYGCHNVRIKNISNTGYVCINYDDNAVFVENILNTNTELAIKGFWHISTLEDTFDGKVKFAADFDFSAFRNKTNGSEINELISKNYVDASGEWGIVPSKYSDSHLFSLVDICQADYCVIRREESEFINTLVVNGINESRFILPIIKGLSNGELTIVNNQGKVVFHSYNYNNDFDGASVQAGTYYYRFTYLDELSGVKKDKKGFIEVFYE